MNPRAIGLLLALAATACAAPQTPREGLARRVTSAIASGDVSSLQALFAPGAIARVEIAEDADELAARGPLESLREEKRCAPGWRCFRATFARGSYDEHMRVNSKGEVAGWYL